MKRKGLSMVVMGLLVLLLGVGGATAQEPGDDIGVQDAVGTAFTYQGRLTDGGSPVNGEYDFRFRLYDVSNGGSPVGAVTKEDVTLTEGLFTVELDFGAAFDGTALWLDIGVRPGSSSGAYTSLTPRQPLRPAPYAHTLRPGASIVGSVSVSEGGILNVTNHSGHGVRVGSAHNGMSVHWAEHNGVRVDSAGHNGMSVNWAGGDGVYVYEAGNPSSTSWSTYNNGFEVAGAEGNGLYVGRADHEGVRVEEAGGHGVYVHESGDDGVYVNSAGDDGVDVYSASSDGVQVYSAGDYGVHVYSAGNDGVHVQEAGNPSTTNSSTYNNGFEVAGAERYGLYVGWANYDGVLVYQAGVNGIHVSSANGNGMYVGSASWDGVEVGLTGDDGVYVNTAGGDGVEVSSAGEDGVHVEEAGNPSTTNPSTYNNGFEVAGAERCGLYVGRADDVGVYVESAGDDGLYVHQADSDGVFVYQAGNPSGTISASYAKNGFQVGGAEENGLYVGRADDDGVHVEWAGDDGVYVALADDNGVYVYSAGGWAGYFNGTVYVAGHLTKAGGGFKIDHPLDPENQYLYHSFVESPDMMNVYNGNVILGADGEAWVTLPDWFEALNRDFRYQLTPIGGPGPGLYIAQEVADNRFKIGGGEPELKVSWQVTGIRRDPYAEANRIPVEEGKPPEERGTYLHPRAYGQPETMGLAYKEAQAREPESPEAGR